MCDPATLAIMAATTVAQSALQNGAVSKVNKATQGAQDKFNADLKERRDTANASFQDSIEQTSKTSDEERMIEAMAKRKEANQPSFNQRVLLPGQGNASGAVKQSIVQTQDRTIDKNANAAEAAARLGAYGDANLGQNITLGQNTNRINTQAGFVQGGLNNLQADTAAAARAGDDKMAMADMVGAIGQLAQVGYGMGAGAGMWGGTDPTTGITWDSARAAVPKNLGPKGISVANPNLKGTSYLV